MKIRDRIKEFRRVPAGDLLPNPRNWRKHPKAQAEALQGILAEIGFAGAVLARETENGLMLIDGHLRVETAGTMEIPVLILDVDENEADKILATFDPLGAMAIADGAKLDAVLRNIQTDNQALATMLSELAVGAGIIPGDDTESGQGNDVPEPPAIPITKPGDLWLLGKHRVLCGDSSNPKDFDLLKGNSEIDCCITDPPYGINYVHGAEPNNPFETKFKNIKVVNDDKPFDPTPFMKFKKIVLWGANHYANKLPISPSWFVWDKREKNENSNDQSDCEIAWTNIKNTARMFRHVWMGFAKASESGIPRVHPTQKPIELMKWCIDKAGSPDVVYDPFLGSGTTLVACEQLGLACYGMEILPEYVDVIIKRWEELTGQTAVRHETP
jgi:DNA modification methylase